MKCQSWPCLFGAVVSFSIVTVPACHAFSAPTSVKPFLSRGGAHLPSLKNLHPLYAVDDPDDESSDDDDDTDVDEEPTATSTNDGRYDVSKLVGSTDDGAGFNQVGYALPLFTCMGCYLLLDDTLNNNGTHSPPPYFVAT